MVQIRPSMARFDHFLVDITPKPCYNNLRWFFLDGEMAERLMALVLKVQHELKKLDKSKVSPMFDIGALLFWMSC